MSDNDTDEDFENPDPSVDPDAGNQSQSLANTFDRTLSTTHSYLGNDLEVLRGRTLLDNGIYLNLPLLFEKSVILFPEQTFPMMEYSQEIINMLRSTIDKNRIFGVVRSGLRGNEVIGTTAEIYEYSNSDRDSFRIKAKGRQRFKILEIRNSLGGGRILADVRILPEIVLEPPIYYERIKSLDRLRSIPSTEDEAKKQEYKIYRRDSMVTPWPSWVYRQYDARRLAMKVRKLLQFVESRGSRIPEDPVELSFWVAQNLIINDATKIRLLRYDCAISRLRYEAKVLSKLGEKAFMCGTCCAPIGRHTDIVPMNTEGLQAAYCNPAGAIHETVTLYHTKNLVLNQEPPSTLCSWFPGYAWTIACCGSCKCHVGWLFTAENENLTPRRFWGLSRRNLLLKRRFSTIRNRERLANARPTRDDSSNESSSDSEDEQLFFRGINVRRH